MRVSQLKNTVIVSGSVSSYERFARIDNMLKSFGKSVTSKEVLTLQSGIVKEVEVSGGEGESTIKFLNLLEVINIPQVELNILVASVDRQADGSESRPYQKRTHNERGGVPRTWRGTRRGRRRRGWWWSRCGGASRVWKCGCR